MNGDGAISGTHPRFLSRRLARVARWIRDRWLTLLLVPPAFLVVAICVSDGVPWIGRVFPGFLVLENRAVASNAEYHWTGMRAGLPFHSVILAVDGQPIRTGNDVYRAVEHREAGVPVTYLVTKDGHERTLSVPTMRFTLFDFASLFGLFGFNAVALLLIGGAVGLLSPRNRATRIFVVMCVLMALYPVTGSDLWRNHRFGLLQFISQCFQAVLFIHLATVFPVERQRNAITRFFIATVYAAGAGLFVLVWRGYYGTPVDLAPLHLSYAFEAVGGLAVLVGSCLAYFQHRRSVVRGRVQIVALGVIAAFTGPIWLFLNNTFGGGDVPLNLVALTIPIFVLSIAYAMVKHRLFDVELIVSRSLVLGTLVAIVTMMHASVVSASNTVLSRSDIAVSPTLSAIIMAVSLAIAFPLRTSLTGIIDRRLFPHKYRFHQTIREISHAIGARVDLAAALTEVIKALDEGVDIQSGTVLLWDDAGACFRGKGAFGRTLSDTCLDPKSPIVTLLDATRQQMFADDFEEDPELRGLRDPARAIFADLHAETLVPIVNERGMVGILALGPTRSRDPFTSKDMEELRALAASIGLAVARHEHVLEGTRLALQRDVVERYLPGRGLAVDAVRHLREFGLQRRHVSIVCARLRGLLDFVEGAAPAAVWSLLDGYFKCCAGVVDAHHGIVERYDGETMIAVFGHPVDVPAHTLAAARCAVALREQVKNNSTAWERSGFRVDIGIGVISGLANVGFEETGRLPTYTAFGTAVEVAERLSEAAKPGTVLAGEAVVEDVKTTISAREIGEFAMPGRASPLKVSALEEKPS